MQFLWQLVLSKFTCMGIPLLLSSFSPKSCPFLPKWPQRWICVWALAPLPLFLAQNCLFNTKTNPWKLKLYQIVHGVTNQILNVWIQTLEGILEGMYWYRMVFRMKSKVVYKLGLLKWELGPWLYLQILTKALKTCLLNR